MIRAARFATSRRRAETAAGRRNRAAAWSLALLVATLAHATACTDKLADPAGSTASNQTGDTSSEPNPTPSSTDTLSDASATAGNEDNDATCRDPQALANTGLQWCSNGRVRRTGDGQACDLSWLETARRCDQTGDDLECETDADCTEGPNGLCHSDCSCAYFCSRTADCREQGHVCVCPFSEAHPWLSVATCVPAYCHTAADCNGQDCRGVSNNAALLAAFKCPTDLDSCEFNEDCVDVTDEDPPVVVCTAFSVADDAESLEEPWHCLQPSDDGDRTRWSTFAAAQRSGQKNPPSR
ncbi:MAG: hypothetical protein B7733_22590 [Myxococcales bacterium FL481]|nr:MAG: hypothetical protein B7733_22590 [Myxococcales bacterium FL481]